MNFSMKPVKGMRDFLPNEFDIRKYVQDTIYNTYKQYGYRQIETPVMEDIALLNSGQGGENEKMIFKILKRGEKLNLTNEIISENEIVDYGLRFDLTLPMIRMFSGRKHELPYPFKVIQLGYAWRAERQQKGRYRQLMQCDIDIIGSDSVLAEAELIYVTSKALLNLGLKDFVIRINDRRILEKIASYCGFKEEDFGSIFIILDKLDKIGVEGIKTELINKSFSSISVDKIIGIINKSIDSGFELKEIGELIGIDLEIIRNLENVIEFIDKKATDYKIKYDISIVRGMGYYTGQIFEIDFPSYKSSVGGGGRYDKMVGKFLKKQSIPACGFSIGFERIVQLIEENNIYKPQEDKKIIVIVNEKELEVIENVFNYSETLRESFNIVSIEFQQKNLNLQLNNLAKQGYSHFVIFKNELKNIEIKTINK